MRRQGSEGAFSRPFCLSVVRADQWCVRIKSDKLRSGGIRRPRSMSKLSHVTLRLLGAFAIEANVGRPIPISVRSRKARALLAYLAMKPDYRARREELATLF